jgi:uncharacterized protein
MLLSLRKKNNMISLDQIALRHYPVTGIFTGIFSALSGLGGGVITVPVLSDIHKLRIKKTTSISLGVMPLLAIFNILAYTMKESSSVVQVAFGYIKPDITIPLVAGVIIFAPIGVKLASVLSDTIIRVIFIIIVGLVIFRMIYGIL